MYNTIYSNQNRECTDICMPLVGTSPEVPGRLNVACRMYFCERRAPPSGRDIN